MNIFQILAICGILGPIVYTVMWILGGILQPDYSHIRDDISSLFAVGAPNKGLMQSFIIASSVLLFVFYIGLHEGINNGGGSIVGPILFLTSSVLGILVALFFPLDAGGEIVTLRGKMHLVLELMLQGFSAYTIARKLEKDPPTVYRSINNARRKLLEAEKDLEWAKQRGFPEKLESKPTKDEESEVRAAF